ncbi:alpha/beta hydrolase [Pelagibacteraceae bacterium GOM-A3]|nr:alpha/beta hydrolase [Pelagibacteraceae bacterium GOM-A3]
MINATDSKGTFYKLNQKKGIPIVFIHGVGLDHNIWDPQINEFDNTVLIYDILGHGRTPLNKEKISFDDFSDQIINLIDELKFSKIHLIGFSIGSLIARNFATRFSDRLKSLTLLCSIFNRSNNEQKIVNERFEQTKKDKKLTKDALNRWFNKDFIEKNPLISDKIFSILNNNNMDNFIKVYSLFVNHKDNEKFENINVKTLVMTGEGDVGSTPEMSDNLSKKIKNSEVKIIPVGKHLCSIECSYDVNKAIKDHIQNA